MICASGKIAFDTKGEVKRYISGMQTRGQAKKDLRPYVCGACFKWHMTSVGRIELGRRHPDRKRASRAR